MSLVRDLSEDEVRDGYTDKGGFHKGAKQILEFDKAESNVQQGTGQLTTFKKLGFTGKGSNHKPDGWYLPDDCTDVAIILETKSSDKDIESKAFIDELLDNVKIANNKYPTRKFYPYIQNAIFMVVTDIHTALGVMKPSSKSAVSSIGQKTFVKGKWVIYQYNMLLSDSSDAIDVNDAKEILQNELIRKSEEGFDGITFDVNGYPYLQVDSVLVDGSYLQVQVIVLWNEAQKSTYEAVQEQKQSIHDNAEIVEDEVF